MKKDGTEMVESCMRAMHRTLNMGQNPMNKGGRFLIGTLTL